MAYGLLGLTPWEFTRLTRTEFSQMAEARVDLLRADDERWMRRLAWVVMWVINSSGKLEQPITVDDLLGTRDTKKEMAEKKKFLEKIARQQKKNTKP